MKKRALVMLGKTIKNLASLWGGGSALPGLIVEKVDPQFVSRTLSTLPKGVVLVSGTNGKTTTTKIITTLLESQGLRVFTNPTGSNFTRGIAAALLGKVDRHGFLDADIAVVELDEAHATHFVRTVKPRYSVLLNVMRDQLDRFGEIDKTAELLRTVAQRTTDGVIINRDDPRLNSYEFTRHIVAPVYRYGVSAALLSTFPSDDTMRHSSIAENKPRTYENDVILESINGQRALISYDGDSHSVELRLKGVYNIVNAVSAITVVRTLMGPALNESVMFKSLTVVEPAFGRGESIQIGKDTCELVLVKNPAGFRLSLQSFSHEGCATMIAINDDHADGRDMSWLWDVDFEQLKQPGVTIVSGVRAYDMALRLQYDDINVGSIIPPTDSALNAFLAETKGTHKRIFCSYTAMIAIRKRLAKYAPVEDIR
ncbi:Mur ligase family protein [Candidatus Saccharibacteria bacterium]|nr:Mur ligase family protein [Candidatus Saccharibacteria bacterium]